MDPQDPMLATRNRLAIVQLVLGILCLINGIGIVAYYKYAIIIQGGAIEIWTELFFIVAGALGIAARTRNRINVHMAFCIVASVMAVILFSEAIYFAAPKRSFYYRVSFSWPHIPLAIFALIEFIISIISAATCCRAECCRSTPRAVIAQPQLVVFIGIHRSTTGRGHCAASNSLPNTADTNRCLLWSHGLDSYQSTAVLYWRWCVQSHNSSTTTLLTIRPR